MLFRSGGRVMEQSHGRRFGVVVALVAAACLLLAACSSSSGASVQSSEPTSTAGSVAADTTVGSTTSAAPATDAPTTTEAPKGLQLDELPGRIAVVSVGCGGDIGDSMSVICIYDPDGSDLVEVAASGENPAYLNWTWDGTKLLFEDETGSYSVNPDGSGLTQRDPLVGPMTSQSPDGKWSVYSRRGENGFWLSPVGSPRSDRRWQQVTSDRKSTRLNSSHMSESRMPSSA